MELLLVTSAFCAACARTRETLTEAVRLVPSVGLTEIDVARHPDGAEALDIRVTPTVLLRDDAGVEVFRAEGVPTLPQVLTVIAQALPAPA
jgi:protein-disulfide isomerase